MQRTILVLSVVLPLCGCAKSKTNPETRAEADHHGGMNLSPATEPCPGPDRSVHVRVLDSEQLVAEDPIAFVREPEIHWVVPLKVVEVVDGEFSGERLGVLVHSPSMFASRVWGFGASPQEQPAVLELRWAEEYCLFEVVDIETPKPEIDPGEPFEFNAPEVHSGIIE